MDAEGLLAKWQEHHGELEPELQEKFLARPEVLEILEHSSAAIEFHLPFHPKLRRLLQRLRRDGRAVSKQDAAGVRTFSSKDTRVKNWTGPKSGVLEPKQPARPHREKTKTKKDRPNRPERGLRKIAQSYQWWKS